MKNLLLLLCAVLSICVANAQTSYRLVDANDQTPIISASIFDAAGSIVGYTMKDGTLPQIPESAYPITIRSIGYELLTITTPAERDWQLIPKNYPIEPVVVVPAKYEVMKQTFYIRMFNSAGNSETEIRSYMEFMAERFVPASKDSKYRGSQKLYAYPIRRYIYLKEKDTTIYHTGIHQADNSKPISTETMVIDLLNMLFKKGFDVPESFKNADGHTTVTQEEKGKSGLISVIKQKGQQLTVSVDILAKKKNHVWSPWLLKVLGMKFNLRQFLFTQTYQVNSEGFYLPKDLMDGNYLMEEEVDMKRLHKLFESDEPVQAILSIEMYRTNSEYLTRDMAESAILNRPKEIPLTIPDRALPLNSATLQLIEAVKANAATQIAE